MKKICLPHGQQKAVAMELGLNVRTVRKYLNGEYGEYSPSWASQMDVRMLCVKRFGAAVIAR